MAFRTPQEKRLRAEASGQGCSPWRGTRKTPPRGRRWAGDAISGGVYGADLTRNRYLCQGELGLSGATPMSRVVAYVDGFNLYFGLRSKGWKKYYWLDLCALATTPLRPGQTLGRRPRFHLAHSGQRAHDMQRQTAYPRSAGHLAQPSSATTSKSPSSAASAARSGWTTRKR